MEAGSKKRGTVLGSFPCRFRVTRARWTEMQQLESPEMETVARDLDLPKVELAALASVPAGSLWLSARRRSHAGLSIKRQVPRACSFNSILFAKEVAP